MSDVSESEETARELEKKKRKKTTTTTTTTAGNNRRRKKNRSQPDVSVAKTPFKTSTQTSGAARDPTASPTLPSTVPEFSVFVNIMKDANMTNDEKVSLSVLSFSRKCGQMVTLKSSDVHLLARTMPRDLCATSDPRCRQRLWI
jgi:hypothetical protein